MAKARLLVLASGTAESGGSGFENLVLTQRAGALSADIVAVASNHEHGGVRERADRLGVRFIHFPGPYESHRYRALRREVGADFIACSGWLKLVVGFYPPTVFNIHPGPLPEFGGKGMYGHHVHEAVLAAYARDEIAYTAICMHFVTPEYDKGPVFFRLNIPIQPGDTPESLGRRVNVLEHRWQPAISNLVVTRQIRWNGEAHDTIIYPRGYRRELTLAE